MLCFTEVFSTEDQKGPLTLSSAFLYDHNKEERKGVEQVKLFPCVITLQTSIQMIIVQVYRKYIDKRTFLVAFISGCIS